MSDPEAKAKEIARRTLHEVASVLAGYRCVPSTVRGVSPAEAADCAIRMCVKYIREVADGKPDTSIEAEPEHLAEFGVTAGQARGVD